MPRAPRPPNAVPVNAQREFRAAFEAAGFSLRGTVVADGKIHRDGAFWYVLYGDGVPTGVFGSWSAAGAECHKWRADVGRKFTPAEEMAFQARVASAQKQREADDRNRMENAQTVALARYEAARPAPANHAYLRAKGIKPPHGIRVHAGNLVAPLRNAEGAITSLQEIFPDGTKRFLAGGAVKGGAHIIGKLKANGPALLCEGLATGASLHEATKIPVVVAFNAGNLEAVAIWVARKCAQLVICADDDYLRTDNLGLAKANEAALTVGALLAVPDFGDDRPQGATDFNDLHQARGAKAVAACVSAATAPAPLVPDGWPQFIDFVARGAPKPPQAIMELLYAGYVTLLSAHGGAGKSSIALFLAVCVALRLSWWGFPVERRRVLFLSCEDRADVLHWRLHHICNFLGVDLSDLRGRLEVMDLVGQDAVLYASDSRGSGPTQNYDVLKARIEKHEIEVLIIDGATDVLAINENDRGAVKRGINALAGLVPADTGAVLLIAHIDKASAKGGGTRETYSGSTAWHNGVRVRAAITPLVTDEGERTGKLVLEVHKSNYGVAGTQIGFEWSPEAHLFVGTPLTAATVQERGKQDQEERDGIIGALRACMAAMVIVPAAATGPRTAFHVLSQHAEFPETLKSGKAAVRRFWRHCESLRHAGDVYETEHRRANGHKTVQFHAKPASQHKPKY